MHVLFAEAASASSSGLWSERFFEGLVGSLVYGLVGLFLILFAFKLFDWMLPKVHFQAELEKGNIAVAVVIGTLFLAVGFIIGQVVR